METTTQIEPVALTAQEAARYLNISRRKLTDLVSNGDIRPARIGVKLLFRRESLDDLLDRATCEQVG